jgi:hypothetical protein
MEFTYISSGHHKVAKQEITAEKTLLNTHGRGNKGVTVCFSPILSLHASFNFRMWLMPSARMPASAIQKTNISLAV